MDLTEALKREKLVLLGRYHVIQRIGRGGMGDVWLCNDPRLKRQVAVKTLPAYDQLDHDFVRRFEREAESAAALSHPHIVAVHDFGQRTLLNWTVIPYSVMPYIKGGSLADRLLACERQSKLLPPHTAFTLLRQAAEEIDYAHKRKLAHRDIKPANMLLRDENWLLLTDFGIACIMTDEEQFDERSFGVGTPEYMAPEQAQGHVRITSDNYSLAIVAFQLFTGHLPFQGETAIATTMQHLIQPPPSPRQFNPALSSAFEHILLQGLAKDPEQRPALASEFITQLEQTFTDPVYQPTSMHTINDMQEIALQDAALTAANEVVTHPANPAANWSRRQFLYTGGITAALLTGGLTGTWAWWTTAQNSPRSIPANAPLSARPTTTGPNKPALILTGHTNPADQLAWTKDAGKLISLDKTRGQLLAWDIAQLRQQPVRSPLYSASREFDTNSSNDLYLSVAPDDTFLAIAYTPQMSNETKISLCTLQLEDITGSNSQITVSDTHTTGIICLPDHYIVLAQNSSGGTYQYRLQVLKIDHSPPHSMGSTAWQTESTSPLPSITSVSLVNGPTNSQKALFVVYGQGSIQVAEIQFTTPTEIHGHLYSQYIPFRGADDSEVMGSGLTADGRYLLAFGNKYIVGRPIIFLDRQNNTQHKLSFPDNVVSNLIPVTLACNPSSLTPAVAVGTNVGSIYLWNLPEGSTPIRQLDVNAIQAEVKNLAWSSDGKWLAASFADDNCTILIWKL